MWVAEPGCAQAGGVGVVCTGTCDWPKESWGARVNANASRDEIAKGRWARMHAWRRLVCIGENFSRGEGLSLIHI